MKRLDRNIEALKIAIEIANSPRTLNQKEVEALQAYSGFGGIDIAHLNNEDAETLKNVVETISQITNEPADTLMRSLKTSTLTAFYTPTIIPQAVSIAMQLAGLQPKRILEPSCGTGNFLQPFVQSYPQAATIAYEIDAVTALVTKALYPNTDLRIAGFQTISSSDLKTFDLTASNIPFADVKVFDPSFTSPVELDACRSLHSYFVMKGVSTLRNGGVLAFLTTQSYLNSLTHIEQVRHIFRNARLVSATRLPNNLFADTEVGTDLLILQKELGKEELTANEWLLTSSADNADGVVRNAYFECFPEHYICTSKEVKRGLYGKLQLVTKHEGGVNGIAADLFQQVSRDFATNINVALFNNNFAKLTASTSKTTTQKPTTEKVRHEDERLSLLQEILKEYDKLYAYEMEQQQENTEMRDELNRLYDQFVARYGQLNKPSNRSFIRSKNLSDLLALELQETAGIFVKADILHHPVAFDINEKSSFDNAHEALSASLNKFGKVNLQYMQDVSSLSEKEIFSELAGEIFFNPLKNEWEIKEMFISGDVISKADRIETIMPNVSKENERFAKESLEALRAATPTPILFADLDFNLGERWMSPEVYENFAMDFFNIHSDREKAISVVFSPDLDQYEVNLNIWGNERIYTEYAVVGENVTYDGIELFTHALHNTIPAIKKWNGEYDANGKKIMVRDEERIQFATSKIEEIRDGFCQWLFRQPVDFQLQLQDTYNRRFNACVRPAYNGSHQTFPDLDLDSLGEKYGIRQIYQSQKDCIWMLKLNQGGICDHEVGTGKTLIMCMTAHEMHRLGIAHKPIIIALKANVAAIAETYQTAYPNARILYASEQDYSSVNRTDFFRRAKNNDYDCIIMSHEQFGKIPQSLEVQRDIVEDELRQLDDALYHFLETGGSDSFKIRKGLEKRRDNLRAKLTKLEYDINHRKDDVIDFAMMGIDHIFVDESHQFKNLMFSTRHERVAGLGNPTGSQRAFNLLIAIRTIQRKKQRDLCATFLSGTTITNSLTELFCLFKYMRPRALARQNIFCFDAWAAIFTRKSTEYEFSITNEIQSKERFRYFIKVPELAAFYNEITDYRTAEDVGIDRPVKKEILHNIAPTEDQKDFIERLMKFAKGGNSSLIYRPFLTDKQQKARMLIATDAARKMALDMRLIEPTIFEDDPNNKASHCAQMIAHYYHKYEEQKGTQFVFSDLSTWHSNDEWNIYNEIRHKLEVEYGIPRSEIKFIQECKGEAARTKVIQQMNEGKVRVLFGSTSMLGTGVNAQQRAVAVHHLDTPWRPSDLEQRNGRAVRKGNLVAKQFANNQVDVIIYAVERSLDSYKFNLLHLKQTFIHQLKSGTLATRTIDEGAMDEKSGMNFSEYMAILSGNTDLLDRAKLERKVAALMSERKTYQRTMHEAAVEQITKQEKLNTNEERIASMQRDLDIVNAIPPCKEGETILRIDGCKETDEKSMGERIIKYVEKANTNGAYIPIGSYGQFPVVVKSETVTNSTGETHTVTRMFVRGETTYYCTNNGNVPISPIYAARQPQQSLTKIPALIAKLTEENVQLARSIEELTPIINKPWHKEDDLKKLRNELAQLDKKIAGSLNAQEREMSTEEED